MNPWIVLGIVMVCGLMVFKTGTSRSISGKLGLLTHRLDRLRIAPPMVFLIALLIGAIPWLLGSVSPPSFHDEFAYLLGADTFAHGRLTNPTPALAEHFETFHEIVRPTYQSKFPPGQSLALAVGQVLGAPIIGAFGAVALACAAGYWMLRAVVTPAWAMTGAALAAIHPLIFSWGQIYWGGGVPLIGSMLLVGGVLRLRSRDSVIASVAIGIAVGIFLNTRLLEGAITCAIVFPWLLFRRMRISQVRGLVRAGFIAAIPVIPIIAWMGYYDWRVTGHPLQLPYLLHSQQYMRAPLFTWEGELPAKSYADERMRQFHEDYEVQEWQRSKRDFWKNAGGKLVEYADGYGGILLIPLLPMLPLVLRKSSVARLCVIVAVMFPILQIGISVYFRPHYAAPMTGFIIALITLMLREWTRVRWASHSTQLAISQTCALLFVAAIGMTVCADYGIPNRRGSTREKMINDLQHGGGKHLILVEYTKGSQQLFEWVYNSAEIDSQQVIWARSLGESKDRELLDHYKDRVQWRLVVDFNHLDPLRRLN